MVCYKDLDHQIKHSYHRFWQVPMVRIIWQLYTNMTDRHMMCAAPQPAIPRHFHGAPPARPNLNNNIT